jgi:hypothetical protein
MTSLKLITGTAAAAAYLAACSPPITQAEHTQAAESAFTALAREGTPGCTEVYELSSRSEFPYEKIAAIVDRGMEITRALFEQQIADVGRGASPQFGQMSFTRVSNEPQSLNITFFMPCNETGETSARLLAAVHNDSAMSQLLDGARFVFASRDEHALNLSAPAPPTGNQQ